MFGESGTHLTILNWYKWYLYISRSFWGPKNTKKIKIISKMWNICESFGTNQYLNTQYNKNDRNEKKIIVEQMRQQKSKKYFYPKLHSNEQSYEIV